MLDNFHDTSDALVEENTFKVISHQQNSTNGNITFGSSSNTVIAKANLHPNQGVKKSYDSSIIDNKHLVSSHNDDTKNRNITPLGINQKESNKINEAKSGVSFGSENKSNKRQHGNNGNSGYDGGTQNLKIKNNTQRRSKSSPNTLSPSKRFDEYFDKLGQNKMNLNKAAVKDKVCRQEDLVAKAKHQNEKDP